MRISRDRAGGSGSCICHFTENSLRGQPAETSDVQKTCNVVCLGKGSISQAAGCAASTGPFANADRPSRRKQDGGAFGDDQRVFEMGGDPAIARAYGPTIFVGEDAT